MMDRACIDSVAVEPFVKETQRVDSVATKALLALHSFSLSIKPGMVPLAAGPMLGAFVTDVRTSGICQFVAEQGRRRFPRLRKKMRA